MGQLVKLLADNPDDLNSIPGTHIVEEKNWLLQVEVHMHAVVYVPVHTHTINFKNI